MPNLWLFVCLGVLFGAVASPMAYIIFYQEYSHHLTEEKARATARRAAITAFVFIVFLATASGWAMSGFGIIK
jgi:small neutral amino acid transporter SnatA (MarC family)